MARRSLYAIGASAVVALLSAAPAQAYVPPPVDNPPVVEVAGETLAETGLDSTLPLIAGASGLILLGGATAVAARRRRLGAIES